MLSSYWNLEIASVMFQQFAYCKCLYDTTCIIYHNQSMQTMRINNEQFFIVSPKFPVGVKPRSMTLLISYKLIITLINFYFIIKYNTIGRYCMDVKMQFTQHK